MEIDIKLNTVALKRAYKLVPQRLEVELKDGFDHISRKFLKEWKKLRLMGPPGIKARPRGIFTRFQRNMHFGRGLDNMGFEVETDSKIAQLHEKGGTVVNRAGGKLAVPLKSSEDARGIMYTKSGKLRKRYRQVRNLKNIVPMKFNNKVFLVRVKKKSRDILPLYVLKKSVRIKPRLGFYATWKAMDSTFNKILNRSFKKALRKAWEGM